MNKALLDLICNILQYHNSQAFGVCYWDLRGPRYVVKPLLVCHPPSLGFPCSSGLGHSFTRCRSGINVQKDADSRVRMPPKDVPDFMVLEHFQESFYNGKTGGAPVKAVQVSFEGERSERL